MNIPRALASLSLAVCCLLAALHATEATPLPFGDGWRPVDPSELSLKTPAVEKDADAEALFWEVHIEDTLEGVAFDHYIRIKIFTERGRESESKIDIPFGKFSRKGHNTIIKDIAARTIKPDGSIVELKKEDIFERSVVRASGLKVKVKSFAMPGIETGAIIEYRWREVREQEHSHFLRIPFQREIPVRMVKYFIKPLDLPDMGMRTITFNAFDNGAQKADFVKEKNGFYSMMMRNVPAYHEEPRMPPEDQVRTWMLMYYTKDEKVDAATYWRQFGKEFYEKSKSHYKPNAEVKQAAIAAIGDASTPEQKLDRLFEFCRNKITNTSGEWSGLTKEQRAQLKENKSPADTLKNGQGTAEDVDLLFAAMATAAGFDVHIALIGPRDDVFFNKEMANYYFLEPVNIAVRVGDGWRFYNPGFRYIPEGMLVWQEEGNQALIPDSKDPGFVSTPMSGPEKSVEKRTAKLALSDDGTLEGDVRIEYTGHLAVDKKLENDDDSPAEREKTLRDAIKARMSTAELSNIQIENVTDAVKPFVYAYHIKVPGYAERTGKRLFIQPAFFQHGVGPLFPTSQRRYDIYFHYPWSEEDDVTISLPNGFDLETPEAPSSFGSQKLSQYSVSLLKTTDNKALHYIRTFYFGGGGNILFSADSYSALKSYFDLVNQQDNHMVTLRQSAATASNK